MALFSDRSVLPTFRAAPDPDRFAPSPYDDLNRLERNAPPTERHAPPAERHAPASPRAETPTARNGAEGKLHPLIAGLFDKLPEPEMEWSLFARQKWLQTAASIFDLMYASSEMDGGELAIRVERSSPR